MTGLSLAISEANFNMARFLGDDQMVAVLLRRKMSVAPAHGTNPRTTP